VYQLALGEVRAHYVIGVDGRHRTDPEALARPVSLGLVGGRTLGDGGCISQRGTFLRKLVGRSPRAVRRAPIPLCQVHARKVEGGVDGQHPEMYGSVY
jgi:hypothetical protein